MGIILETPRLILRRLEPSDAQNLFQTVGDKEVMRFWAPGEDHSIPQTEQRIIAINEHWTIHGFGDWAIVKKAENQIIGFCGLHYISGMQEVNIGYALKKSEWKLGFGTEIVKTILVYGFNVLQFEEIVAVIDPCNFASINLIQKCGFKFWKNGTYMNRPRVIYKENPSSKEMRR